MKELLILVIMLGVTFQQFVETMPDKSKPDWFCFGADAWHTCFVPESAGPKTTELNQKWRIEKFTSGKPTIVNDKLYMGISGGLKCLDAKTGKTLWEAGTSGVGCRQVLYNEGKLYVNS
jgi:outer membrane protein assembly factor BamB